MAIDSYRKRFRISRNYWPSRYASKYLYRFITKRMPTTLLCKWIEWYIPKWIPIDTWLMKVPIARSVIPLLVPCWNYTGVLPLNKEQIVQWAILDTFDALAPRYDFPQRGPDIEHWLQEADLQNIEVRYGGNGVIGNAIKPV